MSTNEKSLITEYEVYRDSAWFNKHAAKSYEDWLEDRADQQPAAEAAPPVTGCWYRFSVGQMVTYVGQQIGEIPYNTSGTIETLIANVSDWYTVLFDGVDGARSVSVWALIPTTGEPPPVAEETVTGFLDDELKRVESQLPQIRKQYAEADLQADNARLQRELAAANEATARLKSALESIALNAPKVRPQQFDMMNFPMADSYYTAGKIAEAALTTATGSVGDANDGSGA